MSILNSVFEPGPANCKPRNLAMYEGFKYMTGGAFFSGPTGKQCSDYWNKKLRAEGKLKKGYTYSVDSSGNYKLLGADGTVSNSSDGKGTSSLGDITAFLNKYKIEIGVGLVLLIILTR